MLSSFGQVHKLVVISERDIWEENGKDPVPGKSGPIWCMTSALSSVLNPLFFPVRDHRAKRISHGNRVALGVLRSDWCGRGERYSRKE